MEKLTKKLILEFLDDEDQPVDQVIDDAETVSDEEPFTELSPAEASNFITSSLNNINNNLLIAFDYLNTVLSTEESNNALDGKNKELFDSICEDLSALIGKVQAGIQANYPEDIKDSMQGGRDEANEIVETPSPEKE